jgi:serine/threonine-protein kinase ATR
MMTSDLPSQAHLALVKVSRVLNGTSMVLAQEEIGPLVVALLNPYLLGVITHVNDTLQDVHGKKNLQEKKRVLRGLGSLIFLLGPVVGRVSPQV